MLPFAALVMVMFAFALDSDDDRSSGSRPGLVWLATLFSLLIVVQRAFASRRPTARSTRCVRPASTRPASSSASRSPSPCSCSCWRCCSLAAGRACSTSAELRRRRARAAGHHVVAATCGLAFVGTLYGGLAAGAKGRETLLPLLLLPVVAPVLIGATRATEAALGTERCGDLARVALGRPARGVRRPVRCRGHAGLRTADRGSDE